MSQNEKNEVDTKYTKKLKREMSKAGQQEKVIESKNLNASFSNNSETEREKTLFESRLVQRKENQKPTKEEKISPHGNH